MAANAVATVAPAKPEADVAVYLSRKGSIMLHTACEDFELTARERESLADIEFIRPATYAADLCALCED